MPELFWLLLPVAAASGWWAAKRSLSAKSVRLSAPLATNPAYVQGLNFLVNEEPDKAIDVFIDLVEIDPDTVETHLALGSLFRRRGEVERAIRIHQNLIARPALSDEHRSQALLELGRDYMGAGLYDRAEGLFLELKASLLYRQKALENLLTVYQQEKDWPAALQTAEELAPLAEDAFSFQRANFHCELAVEAKRKNRKKEAIEHLRQALMISPQCVRALHLQADQAKEDGDCVAAIRLYRRTAERKPDHLAEMLPAITVCFQTLNDLSGLKDFLHEQMRHSSEIEAAILLTDLITQEAPAEGLKFLADHLRHNPSLKGLSHLIQLADQHNQPKDANYRQCLREHLDRLLVKWQPYQCEKCGFVAKAHHWQCPGCRSWGSISRRTEFEENSPLK